MYYSLEKSSTMMQKRGKEDKKQLLDLKMSHFEMWEGGI
jgi:hypothetical protein